MNAGNENLQPQRTWEFRATAEHPFLGDGLIKLDLGHDLISMLQDRILIFDDQGQCIRRAGKYRHRQAQLRRADRRCSARAALERASRQVHRHDPAHQGRRSDRRRSAQLQRLLPRLGVAARRPPRRRQVLVRLHGQRQPALHLLPHRRVRHELQRRPLWHGILRISADARERRSRSTSTICSTTSGNRDRRLFVPNRAAPDGHHRRVPRAQPPPQLRPHAEAELRRRGAAAGWRRRTDRGKEPATSSLAGNPRGHFTQGGRSSP